MKKNKMLLAIDVGNTAISMGLFRDNHLVSKTSISTKECGKGFGKKIMRLLRNDNYCIVASVVPKVNKIIKNGLQKAGIRCRFVKPLDLNIPIRCREPEKVGVDRLMNAIATYKIYKKGAIVVDCGTATTFDVVSPKGEYFGGAIAPGLKIGAEVLAERCAKLFPIKIDFPRFTIGKDTKEAMLSGVVSGHIEMIEGMIGKIKSELKFKPIIIGTGGFISLVKKGTKVFDIIDPDLTLKGLAITYEKSIKVSKRQS